MQQKLMTVKQCSDPAEAAFLANFLEENGIHVENSAEKMGAWTGRYSLLSRGPLLRVHPVDADKARRLLKNPPTISDAELERVSQPVEAEWDPDEVLKCCPLCGSEQIVSVSSSLLMDWVVNIVMLGMHKSTNAPMWICRNCDWDSRRRISD
jgi:hypothetical protein